MQHPVEYAASLRAERARHVMYGNKDGVRDVDAELERIGASGEDADAPMEDTADSTPLETAVVKRGPGRPRKESP